ncbi:hypothetical protein [Rhizosphaericola mali]|uniref:Outer membrane beta-barrel protein n=1 Tax=Rhizosphaericola mali TaxID=2545455 RepID=A0A5P2G0M8_9BACT|nr:hypothetical protein [Rhizosphaericola mali]QES87392.1 hypothetical protein E0W69_001520 [Rhizosphaericola mali]
MNSKPFLIFSIVILFFVMRASAQSNPFYGGYIRIGLNSLGGKPNNELSMYDNLMSGKTGMKNGYAFEFGRIFYFNKESHFPIKFGLDWTYLSATYNKIKWEDYVKSKNDPNAELGGNGTAVTANTKLGLAISYNPVAALVIDIRGQVAYGINYFDKSYFVYTGTPAEEYFSFADETSEDEVEKNIKGRVKAALRPSLGATIRYKAFGIAYDYISGKLKYGYSSSDGSGEEKFKINNSEIKLSLNF